MENNLEYIMYVYKIFLFNILSSKNDIIIDYIKEDIISNSHISWEDAKEDECINTYINNKLGLSEDILKNGLYMPFIVSKYNNKYCLKSGQHRYESLLEYIKYNKNFPVCYIEYEENTNEEYNSYYIIRENKNLDIINENTDLYINNKINDKYIIKELKYDYYLIKYKDKSIYPALSVCGIVAPLLWSYNNRNKENKIKPFDNFNNYYHNIINHEEDYNNLYKELINENNM